LLSSAIGSFGYHPDALAQPIGIVLDGGVRKFIVDRLGWRSRSARHTKPCWARILP
jgi:hypothetical protein